jgi:hypothetical protein
MFNKYTNILCDFDFDKFIEFYSHNALNHSIYGKTEINTALIDHDIIPINRMTIGTCLDVLDFSNTHFQIIDKIQKKINLDATFNIATI